MLRVLFYLMALLGCISVGANAQSIHPGLSDRWEFTIAAFDQHNKIKYSRTPPNESIHEIDFDDLGLKESELVPQFGLRMRFKENWAFGVYHSDFGTSSSQAVTKDIIIGDVIYPVDASLQTDVGLGLYVASVDYAFSRSESTEWGIGFGIHALDLSFRFNASLNDLDLASTTESVIAPLPNFRFYTRHAFSPKLLGSFNVGWLGATIDEYSGRILVGAANLDYRISKRWSLGISYQITDLTLKIDRGTRRANPRFDIVFDGVSFSTKYSIP